MLRLAGLWRDILLRYGRGILIDIQKHPPLLPNQKINLFITNFPDSNIKTPTKKFKIHNILDYMPSIYIPVAKQIIPKADIYNVVFP